MTGGVERLLCDHRVTHLTFSVRDADTTNCFANMLTWYPMTHTVSWLRGTKSLGALCPFFNHGLLTNPMPWFLSPVLERDPITLGVFSKIKFHCAQCKFITTYIPSHTKACETCNFAMCTSCELLVTCAKCKPYISGAKSDSNVVLHY